MTCGETSGLPAPIEIVSFTDRGAALAEQIREKLGGDVTRAHGMEGFSLSTWTESRFAGAGALVFVGAVGIAVRAVAPYLRGKAVDPAVVAVDERGSFVVPVVSGHLGGANDLARAIAAVCGGIAVVTTATDANGVFAVDEWAKRQDCAVVNPSWIKRVSSKILAGESVRIGGEWPVAGLPPAGVVWTEYADWDAFLGIHRTGREGLFLVPRVAVLGVGCRKGTPQEALERALEALLQKEGIREEAICAVATVNLKEEEPGLVAFCRTHGWPLAVFTPEQLRAVQGTFTASDFVRQVTGVDNVCERSAVREANGGLLVRKTARDGVTMALALRPYRPDWRWQNG